MLGVDVVGSQAIRREIVQVEGDDRLRTSPDRGGEHVPIVAIGQNETVDQPLESGDHAVRHRSRHQLARPLEGLRLEVEAVLEDVPEALVQDRVRPPRTHHAGVRQAHEQIAKRGRVEHACVVEDDERHRALIPEAVLLCFGGELVEHLLALGFVALLVRDQIGRLHAAMRADHAEGNLPLVEKTDQERPRDVQEIGGLLRRQLGVNGDDRDRVAVRHLAEDLEEQLERFAGDGRGNGSAWSFGPDLHRSRRCSAALQRSEGAQGSLGFLGNLRRRELAILY